MRSTPSQQLKLSLEATNWQWLHPPGEQDEKAEVGVVEVHPSFNRIAYTTRTRTDQSHDVGKELIVIHDYDVDATTNEVICKFSLRELTRSINEFRSKNQLSSIVAATAHSQEITRSLSSISSSTIPLTVQLLGAVQNLAFLDRDAIRHTTAPGFVRDEPQGIHKVMIGFRRCIVVVSVFKLKNQVESYARGLQVLAYIGPDDLDERETKKKKRQPASFAAPITEHILGYGCYDGGIRFYDLHGRKQAKSALGPNGRSNPIVRVVNANCIQSESETPQKPRIICASANGIAYLWELDLSVDVVTGEIIHFEIPPPIARFDGLVAAISGRGVPLTLPPPLSPSSVASLSPCSSWDQLDLVNSQFELSYDPRRNLVFWVFSPDCIGASLNRRATREERLDSNGAFVAWDLSKLPSSSWPPPITPPLCVSQVPRTDWGRVCSTLVLPGVDLPSVPDSYLTTIYVISSGDVLLAVSDLNSLKNREDCSVHVDVDTVVLTPCGENGNSGNNVCYGIASSRIHPSAVVAMGTQQGVLLTKIVKSSEENHQLFTIDEDSTLQVGDQQLHEKAESQDLVQMLHDNDRVVDLTMKISELEYRNNELEHANEEEQKKVEARVTTILEQQQKFCDFAKKELEAALSRVETLENELKAKHETCESCKATGYGESELERELKQVSGMLEKERSISQTITKQLAETNSKLEALEEEIASKKHLNDMLTNENENLLQELEELKHATTDGESGNKRLPQYDNNGENHTESEKLKSLEKDLDNAKKTEESLRDYVKLLEEDNELKNDELVEEKKKNEDLESELKEQQLSLDSLVALLEHQKRDHADQRADFSSQISALKKEVGSLQSSLLEEKERSKQSKRQFETAQWNISKLEDDNRKLKEDAAQSNGVFLAMKVELQNALNDLADYQHEHNACFHKL